jgi:cell division protease FtsH
MNITIRSKNNLLFVLLSLTILSGNTAVLKAAEEIQAIQVGTEQPAATESKPSPEEIAQAQKIVEKVTPIYAQAKKDIGTLITFINSIGADVKNDKIIVNNKDSFFTLCQHLTTYGSYLLKQLPAQTDLNALDQFQFFTIDIIGYFMAALDPQQTTPVQFDLEGSMDAYQKHIAQKVEDAQKKNLTIDDYVSDLANTGKQISATVQQVEKEIKTLKTVTDLYIKTKASLNELIQILSAINLDVNNNNIAVKNKREFQDNCLELINFTNYLREGLPLQADFVRVYQIQHYTVEISHHLAEMFKTKNPTLEPFDFQKSEEKFSKSLEEKIAQIAKTKSDNNAVVEAFITDLEKTRTKNATLLKDLNKTTSEFGLTAVNKAYRKWNAAVWERMYRYDAHTKFGLSIASFATGILFWKYLAPTSFEKSPLNVWPLKGNSKTNSTDISGSTEPDPAPIALFDFVMKKIETKEFYTLAGLTGITFPAWKSKIYDPLSDWIYKKGQSIHFNLMGGAYKKRLQELENALITPRLTFEDIVGNDHAKTEFQKIIDFLERPEFFNKNKIAPSKGVLLTGLTGGGKSYIVEAFAGEIKQMFKRLKKDPKTFNFYTVPSYYFSSKTKLQELFLDAHRLAPCVLWIDEIDMYNLNRTGNSELLQELLIQMSGSLDIDPDKAIIIVAATNNPQAIDFALKRPGRMETHIEIQLPSFKDRKEFFRRKISGLASPGSIDFDRLSSLTEGQTYQAISNVVNATSFANAVNHTPFSQELLEKNIDRLMHNVETIDCKELPDDEKQLIATHQSGHALAMLLLNSKSILDKVNTKPYIVKLPDDPIWNQIAKNKMIKKAQDIKKYGRVYRHYNKDTHGINAHEELIKQCQIALAGNAAERVVHGECGYTYKGEYSTEYAYELALTIVSKGINLENLSPNLKAKYEEQALELLQKFEQRVYELLNTHKESLSKIIKQLLEREELSRAEICALAGIADTEAPAPAVQHNALPA